MGRCRRSKHDRAVSWQDEACRVPDICPPIPMAASLLSPILRDCLCSYLACLIKNQAPVVLGLDSKKCTRVCGRTQSTPGLLPFASISFLRQSSVMDKSVGYCRAGAAEERLLALSFCRSGRIRDQRYRYVNFWETFCCILVQQPEGLKRLKCVAVAGFVAKRFRSWAILTVLREGGAFGALDGRVDRVPICQWYLCVQYWRSLPSLER